MLLCPHCQHALCPFYGFYVWPFGIKTCTHCQGQSTLAKQPLLSLLSLVLGLLLIIPIYWLNVYWVLLCAVLIISVDYQIDKRLRRLRRL